MLQFSPRKKPTSVIVNFRAKAMAKLDGDDTATTSGIRATTTLCMISKPGKPKNVKEVLLKLKI